jgi:hypothetical protein
MGSCCEVTVIASLRYYVILVINSRANQPERQGPVS